MAYGRLRLHSRVQMLPTVVSRWINLWGPAEVSNVLALVQELFSSAQLANDLLGVVAFDFHGASHGQFWPVWKLS